jgi:murein DD-endopeptidase MepM/ murein hydrolase activator NlpD
VKRVDRRRSERRRQALQVVGLSFALGALVALGLTWRLAEPEAPPPVAMSESAAEIAALEAEAAHAEVAVPPSHGAITPAATTGARADNPRTDNLRTTDAVTADSADVDALRRRDLDVPVDDVDRDDLRDSFSDARGSRSHQAIDIMAPRGTPVLAAEDGRIVKLFNSKQGGLTIYQFDPTSTYTYYYAHLDRYAPGLKEGQTVKRGDTIGTVGSTGNAAEDAPHLHFAIFRLTAERQWHKGTPINPFLVLR